MEVTMSEYGGKMDADKTLEILPRPVELPSDKWRALILTGDITGNSPTDQGATWQGVGAAKYDALQLRLQEQMASLRQKDRQHG